MVFLLISCYHYTHVRDYSFGQIKRIFSVLNGGVRIDRETNGNGAIETGHHSRPSSSLLVCVLSCRMEPHNLDRECLRARGQILRAYRIPRWQAQRKFAAICGGF